MKPTTYCMLLVLLTSQPISADEWIPRHEQNDFLRSFILSAKANINTSLEQGLHIQANAIQTNHFLPLNEYSTDETPVMEVLAELTLDVQGQHCAYLREHSTITMAPSRRADDLLDSDRHFPNVRLFQYTQNEQVLAQYHEAIVLYGKSDTGEFHPVDIAETPFGKRWVVDDREGDATSVAFKGIAPLYWLHSHFLERPGSVSLLDLLQSGTQHELEQLPDNQMRWTSFFVHEEEPLRSLTLVTSLEAPEKLTELTRYHRDGSLMESIRVTYTVTGAPETVTVYRFLSGAPVFDLEQDLSETEYTRLHIEIDALARYVEFPDKHFIPETRFSPNVHVVDNQ